MDPEYICAFPMDGATDERADHGCGERIDDKTGGSKPCESQPITTAEQWMNKYKPTDKTGAYRACAFNMAEGANVPGDTANAFKQVIDLVNRLGTLALSTQNEIRSKPWSAGNGYLLPIEAFYYVDDGSATGHSNARKDQEKYMEDVGKFMPIIRIELPKKLGSKASFHYVDSDQAIKPDPVTGTQCTSYIKSGEWKTHQGSSHMTLALEPTDCARQMGMEEVDRAFTEVVKKFSNSQYWKNKVGMRNQFACHAQTARHKAAWDLEPDRKRENYADTKRDSCNPVFT